LFFATALVWWFFVLPDFATMRTLAPGWVLRLLAVNWVAIFCFYGFFELRYYVRRVQERRFKYNGKFPSEQPSDVFRFKSQNIDNFLRNFFITIPIGTAIEVLVLWAFAKGVAPWVHWADNPGYLVCMALLVPAIHEAYFFLIHRAFHWGPLYKRVHSIHHNSVNPSPWSSLSMHPVEGFLYFASAFLYLLIPSNPFLVLYQVNVADFGAVVGHIGFDKLEMTGHTGLGSHAYAHYLHHKYFEVNYCDNGVLPLDKWLGTWHDGSAEGDRLMQARFRKKKERVNARERARQAAAAE